MEEEWNRTFATRKLADPQGTLPPPKGNFYEARTTETEKLGPFETRVIRVLTDMHPQGCKVHVWTGPLGINSGLPQGLRVTAAYSEVTSSSRTTHMIIQNMRSQPLTIRKGVRVGKVTPATRVLDPDGPGTSTEERLLAKRMSLVDGPDTIARQTQSTIPDFHPERKPDPEPEMTPERRKEKLLEKLDLEELQNWPAIQKEDAKQLLLEFHDVFSLENLELGCTDSVKHSIQLTDQKPFKERYRRIPPPLLPEVEKLLQDMLDVGAIRKSNSPWSSAVVLVRKKDGQLRFCIDLRKLNNITEKDAYPIPRIDDALDSLSGAKHFSSLDLKSGYWQVEMDEQSKQYTAFTVGPLGFYECQRMPFGLCNAPATFQRLMETTLRDLNLWWCLIYLDEIVVFARTPEEHNKRLRVVLARL